MNPKIVILKADISSLSSLSDFLSSLLPDPTGLNAEIKKIELAVDEAVTNIIVHGYAGEEGEIVVTGTIEDNILEIVIRDSSFAFNPLSVPVPDLTASIDERNIGGLGVYLIRSVMDEVRYDRVDGWNLLSLKKKLS